MIFLLMVLFLFYSLSFRTEVEKRGVTKKWERGLLLVALEKEDITIKKGKK